MFYCINNITYCFRCQWTRCSFSFSSTSSNWTVFPYELRWLEKSGPVIVLALHHHQTESLRPALKTRSSLMHRPINWRQWCVDLFWVFFLQNWDDQAHLSFVLNHLAEILELLVEPGHLPKSGQSLRDCQVSVTIIPSVCFNAHFPLNRIIIYKTGTMVA